MTPKEKAKELIKLFRSCSMCNWSGDPNQEEQIETDWAKEAAIICVDEIDAAIDFDWMEVQNLDREHAYWEQVKTEIKNL